MRKIIFALSMLVVIATVLWAQSWNNAPDEPFGMLKKWSQVQLKEWVQASDSTSNFKVVGSDTTIRVKLGVLPAYSVIDTILLYVATAFTGPDDSCCIGDDEDIDKYGDETAVSSTGMAKPTIATRYVSSRDTLYLYYRKTVVDTFPAAGQVAGMVKYTQMPIP